MLELEEKTQLRIERSTDSALIKRVITHPAIYPHVADDFSPPPAAYSAEGLVGHPQVYFLAAWDGDELLGLGMFHAHNAVMYEAHTCLLPNAWGERGTRAARAAMRWIFGNTPCRKIVSLVPDGNVLAMRFAKRCGLRVEGLLTKSFLRGGKLLNQTVFGIEKCQQPQLR